MNKENITSIFNNYGRKVFKSDEYKRIEIGSNEFDMAIEQILINYKLEKAELEAKVYTYEKIIANSNFKSVLSKDKQALEKRIKELEKMQELEQGKEWKD